MYTYWTGPSASTASLIYGATDRTTGTRHSLGLTFARSSLELASITFGLWLDTSKSIMIREREREKERERERERERVVISRESILRTRISPEVRRLINLERMRSVFLKSLRSMRFYMLNNKINSCYLRFSNVSFSIDWIKPFLMILWLFRPVTSFQRGSIMLENYRVIFAIFAWCLDLRGFFFNLLHFNFESTMCHNLLFLNICLNDTKFFHYFETRRI